MNKRTALLPTPAWLYIFASVICALAYAPGLTGGFLFDDMPNIVENPALNHLYASSPDWLSVALFSGSGPLRRPVSMLSLGFNVYVFGMDPFAFKTVNLIIHLLNGALIYAIGRRVASRLLPSNNDTHITPGCIALVAATVWLLHPLHISGVLYIVQRMNELSTLFALAGLLCYTEARLRMLRGEPDLFAGLLGLGLFGLLSILSKENGALITAFALVIEVFCFQFAGSARQSRVLKFFFLLTVALPVISSLTYLIGYRGILSYERNGFTFYTHLLSETRVLCDYLTWIFFPLPASLGMFHDDIAVSEGLLNPASTVFCIFFLFAIVIAAWALRRHSPGIAFGVAWFLVGQSMESSILPLELVFEHRNYLPSAGLLLGTICALIPLTRQRLSLRALQIVSIVAIATLAGLTTVRASSWGDPLSLALVDAHHHPNSARSQYQAGREILIAAEEKGQLESAKLLAAPYFVRAMALNPYDIYSAVAYMMVLPESEPIPEAAVADLAYRLTNAQSSEQANAFLDMLIAAANGKLRLSPKNVSSLVEAALANPRWRPTIRAMIFNNYGSYLFNVVHDQQAAIKLVLAADAEDPKNPYFQISLTKIGLVVGQKDQARLHLAKARELNRAGVYDREIQELQVQIDN